MSLTELEDRSLQELFRLTDWFEMFGTTLTVIGGWAVFAHVPNHEGSVDIDLVGPSLQSQQLVGYMVTNDFEERRRDLLGVEVEFYKETDAGEIHLDWVSYNWPNRFKINDDAVLPFGLCSLSDMTSNANLTTPHDQGLRIRVPIRELLLLCKLKAYTDRVHVLRYETPEEQEWWKGRAGKDVSDVVALIDPDTGVLRHSRVADIVSERDLEFLIREAVEIPASSLGRDGIRRSGRPLDQAARWLRDLPVIAGME